MSTPPPKRLLISASAHRHQPSPIHHPQSNPPPPIHPGLQTPLPTLPPRAAAVSAASSIPGGAFYLVGRPGTLPERPSRRPCACWSQSPTRCPRCTALRAPGDPAHGPWARPSPACEAPWAAQRISRGSPSSAAAPGAPHPHSPRPQTARSSALPRFPRVPAPRGGLTVSHGSHGVRGSGGAS